MAINWTTAPIDWNDVTTTVDRDRVAEILPATVTVTVRELWGTAILPAPGKPFSSRPVPLPEMFVLSTGAGDYLLDRQGLNSAARISRVNDDY